MDTRYSILDTRKIKKVCILIAFFCFMPSICCAQPVSSVELINNAKDYDAKTVVYEGEVIGDIMIRGEYVWLNVNDGDRAIGVWAPLSLIKDINYSGSYQSKGDWVEITGIFYRACPIHAGELDVHAQAIKKTNAGKIMQERLIPGKRNLAIVLLGVSFAIWILTLLKRK